MKYFLIPIAAAALISGCASSVKMRSQNYDDAYFIPSDIDKSAVYGKVNPDMFRPRATSGENARATRSYGQSYNDRLRNFGGSAIAPAYRPSLFYSPMGMYGMYNPYGMYGYNPYMNPYGYNPYQPFGYGMGYGYGYNPYFYDPDWYYWNQYYSPYCFNYWGGRNTGGSFGSGTIWGGNRGAGNTPVYVGSGQRRNSYNSTLPSQNQRSRTGSSGSTWSGSSSSSTSSNDTYYRPSYNSGTGSSSGSTYSRPSSSGPTQSTGGGQSGSSGRRR